MIATTEQCLSLDELKLLVSGEFSTENLESAIEHLDQCPQCQTSFDELAADELETDGKENGTHAANRASRLQVSSDAAESIESACHVAIAQLITQFPVRVKADASLVANRKLGPYNILGPIGVGGMGLVFLAEHERLRRKCAIKFLPRSRVSDTGWLARFDREMRTVAALEHPHIVRATDAGHEDGWHYLVMEYLDGLDVGQLVARVGRINVADACQIVAGAAAGLAHVHSRGLIHRDIKPSNLMVTREGTVKLLDLGLVLAGDDPLAMHEPVATAGRLTTVGHMLGTMPYMSPEQLLDSRYVDPASDVYSLGASLYRLLSGRVPHTNRHGLAAQVLAITNELATPLTTLVPNIAPELSGFVAQMLSRDPAMRPRASEVAERMKTWSGGANLPRLVREAEKVDDPELPDASAWSLLAKPASPPPRSPWPRWLMAGFAAGGVFLAGVIVIIKTQSGEVIVQSPADEVTVTIQPDAAITARPAMLDERAIEAPADEASDEPTDEMSTRTYQGHPYAYWFDIISREQDAETLTAAMNAVEILSRDTSRRLSAAQATMKLARRLGGMIIGDQTPFSTYMDAMHRVFPAYLPEPGLVVLDDALRTGNAKSRMAASWILRDYLNGVYAETAYGERAYAAKEHLKQMADGTDVIAASRWCGAKEHLKQMANGTEQERAELSNLLAAIGEAINLNSDPSQLETLNNDNLWMSAMQIVEISEGAIAAPTWLNVYAQRGVDDAAKAFAADSLGVQRTPYDVPEWVLQPTMMEIVLHLHKTGSVHISGDLAAAIVTHPKFNGYRGMKFITSVMTDFEDGPGQVRESLRARIGKIVAGDYADESAFYTGVITVFDMHGGMGGGMGGGGMGGMGGGGMAGGGMGGTETALETLRASLSRNRSFWTAVFDLLGEDQVTTAESLATLVSLRAAKQGPNDESVLPDELQPAVDAAVEKLQQAKQATAPE